MGKEYTRDEIVSLQSDMTPGSWRWVDQCLVDKHGRTILRISRTEFNQPYCIYTPVKADAEFIAAAPDIVRSLLAEIERLQQELEIANQLYCPTCGYPVEEINRNGLYIAARCDWCNEVVHIEKE